jgi:hypothetical protein
MDSKLQLDLSLPDLLVPQESPQNALQNNVVLRSIMNRIIEFMKKLDLKPLGIAPVDIETFAQEPPEITHTAGKVTFNEAASESDLENVRGIELNIAKKVLIYEKYQCEIINYVNKIFHLIDAKINSS